MREGELSQVGRNSALAPSLRPRYNPPNRRRLAQGEPHQTPSEPHLLKVRLTLNNTLDTIHRLVAQYRHNRDLYHRPDYNETQARIEFIDPLFIALGWDVRNEKGNPPGNREVEHEAPIRGPRAEAGVRTPDYAFRVGSARKFFVEAKKPAVDILGGAAPAYQLRSYAWSAEMPLSILTDFEEFSVYDTRIPPQAGDPPSTARVLYASYDEYPDRWGRSPPSLGARPC